MKRRILRGVPLGGVQTDGTVGLGSSWGLADGKVNAMMEMLF
jgi:hypothetical protein